MDHSTKQAIKWIEEKLNGEISCVKPLKGGTSSLLHEMTIKKDSKSKKVVLREFTNKEWLEEEPTIVSKEVQNLKEASKLVITTPTYIVSRNKDSETEHPFILMSKVEGKVQLKPSNLNSWLEQLAETLHSIHSHSEASIHHQYVSYNNDIICPEPTWSKVPKKWEEAFHYLNTHQRPAYKETFIHRDFHPTNVLWKKEQVSAVVDWPNACLGPREIDVAHCRWNLAMMYGLEVADTFLDAYLKVSKLKSYSPYWDLEALKNVYTDEAPGVYPGWKVFGLTHLTPDTMIERMDRFLIQAIGKM